MPISRKRKKRLRLVNDAMRETFLVNPEYAVEKAQEERAEAKRAAAKRKKAEAKERAKAEAKKNAGSRRKGRRPRRAPGPLKPIDRRRAEYQRQCDDRRNVSVDGEVLRKVGKELSPPGGAAVTAASERARLNRQNRKVIRNAIRDQAVTDRDRVGNLDLVFAKLDREVREEIIRVIEHLDLDEDAGGQCLLWMLGWEAWVQAERVFRPTGPPGGNGAD